MPEAILIKDGALGSTGMGRGSQNEVASCGIQCRKSILIIWHVLPGP